ncbi:slc44a2 [Symbiodinium sp. KB8]|nr:slc44a2 [Symbiodinium sp. KB8]
MMVIAGAVAKWYFTRAKNDKKELGHPLRNALRTTLRFHLGTAAFGGFVIALIQLIRAILEYIDRKTKAAQARNAQAKLLMKCVKCCLWCFEKCVKFLSKYAYIFTAMKGYSFCKAARNAIGAIISNAAQVGTLDVISSVLLFIAKLLVVACCVFIGFVWLDNDPQFSRGMFGSGG